MTKTITDPLQLSKASLDFVLTGAEGTGPKQVLWLSKQRTAIAHRAQFLDKSDSQEANERQRT